MDAILTWRNMNLQTGSASPNREYIYGVSWDKTSPSTKLTRIGFLKNVGDPNSAIGTGSGASPFDSIYPWSEMCVETIDGNQMVKIPKYYVKVDNTDTKMEVRISPTKRSGYHVSPAHCDRGDGKGERDYIYVSRYTLDSSYKSTSGNESLSNITRDTARTNIIQNNIEGFYQYDYLTYLTILYLYIVEFANWNAQDTVGYGYSDSGNTAQTKTGATNDMTYHTGTAGASRRANATIQYRHIENLWGNLWQFVDGIYFSDTTINVIKNPNKFSDTKNGTSLSFTRASDSGYISDLGSDDVNPEYIYPTANGGTESTYIPDYNNYNSSGVILVSGGTWGRDLRCGVCCLYGNSDASFSSEYLGARSIYLP